VPAALFDLLCQLTCRSRGVQLNIGGQLLVQWTSHAVNDDAGNSRSHLLCADFRLPVQVHTVPTKVTGKCGSVTIRLIPAPRGAGIVAARTPKKVLQMAGIEDCYTGGRIEPFPRRGGLQGCWGCCVGLCV
jgi:hypothetical protein